MSETIHEMPARAFDAWEIALGCVPVQVSAQHHGEGLYLDKPLGALVYENHRYGPKDAAGDVLFIRGLVFTRGPA